MANKLKVKLSKKQLNRLARTEYPAMCAEIVALYEQIMDQDDEYARLLTANEQLRAGMEAIIELARGNA